MFCVDLRTNSDYCSIQHKLVGFYNRDGECLLRGTDWVLNIIDWLVFITEKECVYCAVRTGSLNIIDWLVFITEKECVYCAERTGSLNIID